MTFVIICNKLFCIGIVRETLCLNLIKKKNKKQKKNQEKQKQKTKNKNKKIKTKTKNLQSPTHTMVKSRIRLHNKE